MRSGRLLGAINLVLSAGALGGCVAAAIPIAAAGLMARGEFDNSEEARRSEVAMLPAPGLEEVPSPSGIAVMTGLTELPPPSASPDAHGRDAVTRFSDYALQQAMRDPAVSARESALLAEASSFDPKRRECGERPPAILIDLDPGRGAFDPLAKSAPPEALGPALLSLREQGVAIAWQSRLGVNFAEAVRDVLRATQLDPLGRDTLLLARSVEERKQTLRDEFGAMHCIVAMLGDERADFDELYLYLKDPDAAFGLESMIDEGWFVTDSIFRGKDDAA